MNGAEAMLRALVELGVDVCFTNPGTSEMHFVAALDSVTEMRGVLTLFEGVATGAADGYGRIAKRPAVTLLHLGPGLGNGLANLHNAKRARTPIVNVVGDHTNYHRHFDPPLASDINAIAGSVSKLVTTVGGLSSIVSDTIDAYRGSVSAPKGVSTLIVPADYSWGQGATTDRLGQIKNRMIELTTYPASNDTRGFTFDVVAKMLRSSEPTTFLLGGSALSRQGLLAASRIANSFGAKLISETFPAVMDRGAGVVAVDRLAYFGEFAQAQLAGCKHLVLVGTSDPISFFAYPNSSSLFRPPDCDVEILAGPLDDAAGVLTELVEYLGVAKTVPTIQPSVRPEIPTGPLTATTVAAVIGATLPEGTIVSDEGNTGSLSAPGFTQGAPPHVWMCLTGGSIGQGLPVATGAAVAAPDQNILCLQADGSALYTIQSLWTQARENLNVTTVLLNNRSYAILEFELDRVDATVGDRSRSMFELSPPTLDFVSIANGFGVDAVSVTTPQELAIQLRRAYSESGPHLIEAILPKGFS